MKSVRIFLRSTGYQIILRARDPVDLAFSLAFSIGIVPVIGVLFGDFPTGVPGIFSKNTVAWDAIGINLAALAFISIPTSFAFQRSFGLFKMFRTTPLTGTQVILSFFVASFVTYIFFAGVVMLTNQIIYGLYFPLTFDSIALVILGVVLGGMAMIPLGLIVAVIVRSSNAVPPFGQLLFIPNLLLSGLSIRGDFPTNVEIISNSLPLTHSGSLLRASWEGMTVTEVFSNTAFDTGGASIHNVWILLAYFAVFTIVIIRTLKWE